MNLCDMHMSNLHPESHLQLYFLVPNFLGQTRFVPSPQCSLWRAGQALLSQNSVPENPLSRLSKLVSKGQAASVSARMRHCSSGLALRAKEPL